MGIFFTRGIPTESSFMTGYTGTAYQAADSYTQSEDYNHVNSYSYEYADYKYRRDYSYSYSDYTSDYTFGNPNYQTYIEEPNTNTDYMYKVDYNILKQQDYPVSILSNPFEI